MSFLWPVSPIYADRRSRDAASQVGCKEQIYIRDLFRLKHSLHWQCLQVVLQDLRWKPLRHICIYNARCNANYTDVLTDNLSSKTMSQADYARLAGRISDS